MKFSVADDYREVLVTALNNGQIFVEAKNSLESILRGETIKVASELPHRKILVALNTYGGVVCAPIEGLRDRELTPDLKGYLADFKSIFDIGKELAVLSMQMMKYSSKQLHTTLRHFRFRFHKLFTIGWLEDRGYTKEQYDRIITAAANTARKFLAWLVDILKKIEARFAADESRDVIIGGYAKSIVCSVSQRDGFVVMKTSDRTPKMFVIAPESRKIWRVLRALIETKACDGVVELPSGSLQLFCNTQFSEFSAYIHSTGEKNHYRLMPYPKSGYQRG